MTFIIKIAVPKFEIYGLIVLEYCYFDVWWGLCCCWVCTIYLCACLICVFFAVDSLPCWSVQLRTLNMPCAIFCCLLQSRDGMGRKDASWDCAMHVCGVQSSCLEAACTCRNINIKQLASPKHKKIYTRNEILCLCLFRYESFPPNFLKHKII